ncbi:MAG: LysR family transcriptional regulator [Rhodospirillaceae bacterium]|nr:LysR family transcriptional regulator [Rhodospirillaceae bacterium]
MDTLNGYTVFTKVVETGGFSAAARDLNISKSAVSKHIAKLEDHLGVRLLNRTTRKLSPTEVGATFYERARRIVQDVEETEQAVSALHVEPRGTLRLNVPMSFGVSHVAPILADFSKRYPDLNIDIVLNDRVVDLLDEGFDAAIRIARLPDSTLIARKLAPMRLILCATPQYWKEHGIPEHPSDLQNHNCLIYSYLLKKNEWSFKGPDGDISVKVSGTISANNGDALRGAALKGVGVYLSPTFIVGDDLRSGRLQSVLNHFMETDLAIYAVYPHNRYLSAKVRAFVDFLAEHYGPEPYWDGP